MTRRCLATLFALLFALQAGCAAGDAEEVPEEVNTPPQRTDLRVMSFNVLCSFCGKDEHDPWADRVPHLQRLIAQHEFGDNSLWPSDHWRIMATLEL